MKSPLLKATALTALAALITGCTNIKNDQARTRTEGSLAGAGLGAVIGGIAGGWRGAAIGAAAGGLVGLAAGDHVARKKAKYASQEAWLNACIAQAQATNHKARTYNQSLTAKIARLEAQIDAARAAGNKRELKQLKPAILSLQKSTKEQIQILGTEINEQNRVLREAGNTSGGITLNTEVGEMRSSQSSLQQQEAKLADLFRRLDL